MKGSYKINSKSIYHDMFHKIYVCDGNANGYIEGYDINKDKWMMIQSPKYNNMEYIHTMTRQLWVAEHDQNLLCRSYSQTGFVDTDDRFVIETIDLRCPQNKENGILWTHCNGEYGISSDVFVLRL